MQPLPEEVEKASSETIDELCSLWSFLARKSHYEEKAVFIEQKGYDYEPCPSVLAKPLLACSSQEYCKKERIV